MKGLVRFYFLAGLFLFGALTAFSQQAKYQSEIVYRLSQHVIWPAKSESYKFVIGVVGNAEDFESFQKMAISRHTINNRPIEVRYFECADDINACHLLYVSNDCEIRMEKIVKKSKNEPILIISGKEGNGEAGAIINFTEDYGKLKFELNGEQAAKRGLSISDQLKNIALPI